MTMTILPPNASPLERALEDVMATRIDAITAPLRAQWDPEHTPVGWLPAQAWGVSVDEWAPDWPTWRKRAVIAGSIALHRIKGTLAGVRTALTAAGYPDAQIIEGSGFWRYGDGSAYGDANLAYGAGENAWAYYKVILSRPIAAAEVARVERILREAAPARCHLTDLVYSIADWVYGDGTQYGPDVTYYGS